MAAHRNPEDGEDVLTARRESSETTEEQDAVSRPVVGPAVPSGQAGSGRTGRLQCTWIRGGS